jgi:hypothetical protein
MKKSNTPFIFIFITRKQPIPVLFVFVWKKTQISEELFLWFVSKEDIVCSKKDCFGSFSEKLLEKKQLFKN